MIRGLSTNRVPVFLIQNLEKAVQHLAHPKKQASEPSVAPPANMQAMFIPVPIQPNNFGYFPMYNMPQQQQPVFFNPYLVNPQQAEQAQV